MLEKPLIPDADIIACLSENYDFQVQRLAFLPLGADRNTAVYRAETGTEAYFVKLRRGEFDESSAAIPALLRSQGMSQVIAPRPTLSQHLWTSMGDFAVIVSPFVTGHSGFEVPLRDSHWVTIGQALKHLHTTALPAALHHRLPKETYTARWRLRVLEFLALARETSFADETAAALAAFLQARQDEIAGLVQQAERLSGVVQAQSLPSVLCHADIHVGNVLVDAQGALFVVDWDTVVLAPKERDLMFIGAGLGGGSHTPEEEMRLFYQGYGATEVDPVALAYYRFERIVQDIAAYCEQLLLTHEGGQDRAEGLRQLTTQFERGGVVERAYTADALLPPSLRLKQA